MNMETLLHTATRNTLSAAERKALDDKAEREFDLAFLARMKIRKPPDRTKNISHTEMKKRLGR